jgi:thiol-disulfide isomerase/thioredoxin
MNTGYVVVVVAVLIAAFGLAFVIGKILELRRTLRPTDGDPLGRGDSDDADGPGRIVDTTDLGLSTTGPTVLHFGAVWCGPCAGVRRVVNQVCAELPQVAHVEIDMDANPGAARRLSVLSLPTTFVFDAAGRQRYRSAGVPKAADLRSVLEPLLAT